MDLVDLVDLTFITSLRFIVSTLYCITKLLQKIVYDFLVEIFH